MLMNKKNGEPMTLDQVSEETDIDRSTAFRSLQKACYFGVANQRGRLLHVYSAVGMETFKKEIENLEGKPEGKQKQ
jgi:predicted transcriptional regulator